MTSNPMNLHYEVGTAAKVEPSAKADRLAIIDLFRGTAHVLMAFDHSGYYSGSTLTAETYNGVLVNSLGTWYDILLGLITNVVTIIFFTLTGVSVSFFEKSRRKKGWTEWEITRFLLIRALILFAIDMTIGTLYWEPHRPSFEVFSAVACCLAILAFVRLLPLRVIAFLAVAILFGYPLLIAPLPLAANHQFDLLTTVLFYYHADAAPYVGFTLIGRIPIVMIGYVAGRLLNEKKLQIDSRLVWVALALLALWLVIRLGGGYGNFFPYQAGMPEIYFLIENKEPSSIAYNLFNLAGAIGVLLILHRIESWLKGNILGRILTAFGQTSLFFYVIHLLIFSLVLSQIITRDVLPNQAILRAFLMTSICLVVMIPLSFSYRSLRQRYPNSILRFL
ncbi:MAG: OpgC domain-containing protein [Chloroflexi bacterium]|nr:OpgC domain-containing protein [Chloroflexota bacterium]MCC6894449.1 OpgC domain-containing protein [Anaerolineae bacterium]